MRLEKRRVDDKEAEIGELNVAAKASVCGTHTDHDVSARVMRMRWVGISEEV